MPELKTYAIFTAARNEAAFIGKTIKGVISQTVSPLQWIIVSDGSTDSTDDIVKGYAEEYDFIKLVRLDHGNKRDFASKVYALREAYSRLAGGLYDCIGNLDADIELKPDYFETILGIFSQYEKLGVAGGIITEEANGKLRDQMISLDSVAGAIQMFRRECFEATGGYNPQIYGGEDGEIEIKARMNGWQVKTFPDIKVLHLRPDEHNSKNVLKRRFLQGKMFYQLGYHPVFFAIRALYKTRERPLLIGSILQILGFWKSMVRRDRFTVSADVANFLRREQMKKLHDRFAVFNRGKQLIRGN